MYSPIFLNHDGDMLRYPYKDYSSLNRWQTSRDLLSLFTSVTTQLCQGKKVSIFPSGDANHGPVPSRRGLIEYNPYCAKWAMCSSCDES
jgi:hypothetical protein